MASRWGAGLAEYRRTALSGAAVAAPPGSYPAAGGRPPGSTTGLVDSSPPLPVATSNSNEAIRLRFEKSPSDNYVIGPSRPSRRPRMVASDAPAP